MIVGVMGRKRAGKDCAAAPLLRCGYVQVNFADRVREMALAIDPLVRAQSSVVWLSDAVRIMGWTKAKEEPDVRRLLQRIGTEGGRDILGADVWVGLWRKRVDDWLPGTRVVATDVRFSNEAAEIRSRGGIIVRIDNPRLPDDDAHASEQAMAAIEPDAVVVNDLDICDLQAEFVHVVGELQRQRGGRWLPGLSGAELLRMRGDLPAGVPA